MSSEALPSLISELMSSKSDGDRIRTRARFENRCQILDTKLNHHVRASGPNISKVLSTTSKISQTISTTRQKCHSLKERIIICQDFLACKRDHIRRLWLESLEHKHVYLILAQIRQLRSAPNTVNDYLLEKNFLEATELLMLSISNADSDLGEIGVMVNLKIELQRLVDKLYSIFVEELRQELFMSTFRSVFQGSHDINNEDITYEKVFGCRNLKESSESINFNVAYVKTLLQCIVKMEKITNIMDILKDGCQGELMKIVTKLSKYMCDIVAKSTESPITELPVSQGESFLADLVGTILGHFRQISLNHRMFFHILNLMLPSDAGEPCYQLADVYSNIQTVLEFFVTNYLEVQTGPFQRQNSSVFTNVRLGNLSAFFLNSHEPERRRCKLFKISNTEQSLIRQTKKIFEQCRESDLEDDSSGKTSPKLTLVCKPSLRNITVMFDYLKRFILEIEKAMDYETATSPFYMFLNDSAYSFLDQVNSEINRILENASCSLESWAISVIPSDAPDSTHTERPILSSTLFLYDNLKEMHQLMSLLPDYSDHFLQQFYYVVQDYRIMARKVFDSLFSEAMGILSVSWATDEDINRLLKSFSNWKYLEISESGEMIESPEDIRLRNKEESELLIRNLNSKEGLSLEIINDYNVLYNISVLEESLQWFSRKMVVFGRDFKCDTMCSKGTSEGTSEMKTAEDLEREVKGYEEFSDTCLMALHLEVRAHCFHHLLKFTEGNRKEEVETCMQNLANDLMKIDDNLYPVLPPKEFKYVYEGIGELIASILINSAAKMAGMDESGIKRLNHSIFVVQCCLSNITSTRETSLERARQYFQLLSESPDEILNEIVEEGPRFREHEYLCLLNMVSRDSDSGRCYEDKLKKIFRGLQVTL